MSYTSQFLNPGYQAAITQGIVASAPAIPQVSTTNLTNNGDTTTVIRRAVLHNVSPNLNNPATASVLIENRLPPRSGFSLPSGFGPVYAAGTVGVTGPFINNPTTFEGGSLVSIDTSSKTVVSLLQGTSTQFPSSAAALVATHTHTGAVDSNGNQMPTQIDLVEHVTNALTKPNFASMPVLTEAVVTGVTPTYHRVGYPAYDVDLIFTLDVNGTTSSPWLQQIQIIAIPAGSYQDLNHGTGKILFDTVPAISAGYDYTGTHTGVSGATYRCYVGGLSAGVSYNIYACYLDFYGNISLYGPTTTALILTTNSSPATINNLPGLGTLPSVEFDEIQYANSGLSNFNANVKMHINYTGTTSSQWLQEIRLYAQLWNPAGSGTPYTYTFGGSTSQSADPVLVNIVAPNDTSDTNQMYFLEWPSLSQNTDNSVPLVYRLTITFVAENGDESAPVFVTNTEAISLTVYRPALATFATGVTPTATAGTATYPFDGNPQYDCEFTFTTDSQGTTANQALNYLQIVAYPAGTDISASVNAGKVLYDVIAPLPNGTTYTGASLGTSGAEYHVYVGGLQGSTTISYVIALIYVDFAGNRSVALPLVTTGAHPVTNNVLPGLGTIPACFNGTIAYSDITQATLNAIMQITVDWGSADYLWAQDIELWALMWDPNTNAAYVYQDGSGRVAAPVLFNIISALPVTSGGSTYICEWPGLATNNGVTTEFVYQLGVKFVSQNGSKSSFQAIANTAIQKQVVYRATLATMPSTYQPTLTSQTLGAGPSAKNPLVWQASYTFELDSGTLGATPWADHLRVFAIKYYSNITSVGYDLSDPPSIDTPLDDGGGNLLFLGRTNYAKWASAAVDIPISNFTTFSGILEIPIGETYLVGVAVIDHSGKSSPPIAIGTVDTLAWVSPTPSVTIESTSFIKGTDGNYQVMFTFNADTTSYTGIVASVEVEIAASGISGAPTRNYLLPASNSGHYTIVLGPLIPSASHTVNFQYISYGGSTGPAYAYNYITTPA